jgi:hypothetical protein
MLFGGLDAVRASIAALEALAREIHESTGGLLPVDAIELATLCGCEVVPWRKAEARLDGNRIWYPQKARHTRQHGSVCHELAHWALRDAGMDWQDEEAAKYLGGALLLPRAAFLRDLEGTGWDLFGAMASHPNASAEAVAVRMCQVSPATTAAVWDSGKLHRSYGLALDAADLVDRVLTTEQPETDGELRGWPIIDGRWRRVVVVHRAA